MNQLINQGVAKNLIAFDADQKNITHKTQNKRLRFNDPEEKVRAIREGAKRLRQQAETELESAKRRIEALLLGDAA